MEAEVSLTLEACTCVLFTMFCTLTLISCMVLVTSSMAEDACNPILAESSEAPATWLEALATCDEASRTLRTSPARPSTIWRKRCPACRAKSGASHPPSGRLRRWLRRLPPFPSSR